MCAVSALFDYGRTVPMPYTVPNTTPQPPQPPQGSPWTRESFEEFKDILKRLEAWDEKMNQPDCEDPAKAAWMREVEKRLQRLETSGEDR